MSGVVGGWKKLAFWMSNAQLRGKSLIRPEGGEQPWEVGNCRLRCTVCQWLFRSNFKFLYLEASLSLCFHCKEYQAFGFGIKVRV